MSRFVKIIGVWLLLAFPAAAERYWAGPVVWDSNHYRAPTGVTGWIDLRTNSERATEVTGTGVALFATADGTSLGASYTNLGIDLARVLTNPQRNQLQAALRLPNAPASNVLREILYEALTVQADPTGQNRAAPLLPNRQRRIEVWLAGRKLLDRPFAFAGPEAPAIKERLRNIYRAIRQAVVAGQLPPDHHRKWLGFQLRKYRTGDYRWFQPDDVPDEQPIAPTTTLLEDFDKADGAGLGPDLTWANVVGAWSVFSNTAYCSTLSGIGNLRGFARAEHDLSGDDHYAQGVVTVLQANDNRRIGVTARANSSNEECYAAYIHGSDTADALKLVSNSSTGTETELATKAWTVAVPHTVKLECDGSTIKVYVAGAEEHSVTDTAITGNLRCGVCNGATATTTGARIDNFEAADLAAGGSVLPLFNHYYTGN